MQLALTFIDDCAWDVVHLNCARGRHGTLVDGEPQDHGTCVNVEHCCSECGRAVSVTSWTKAAWDEHLAKQARRTA